MRLLTSVLVACIACSGIRVRPEHCITLEREAAAHARACRRQLDAHAACRDDIKPLSAFAAAAVGVGFFAHGGGPLASSAAGAAAGAAVLLLCGWTPVCARDPQDVAAELMRERNDYSCADE